MLRASHAFFALVSLLFFIQGDAASVLRTNQELPPAPADENLRQMVTIEGRSYYFGMYYLETWDRAKSICSDMGMQMLTLNTQAKNDLIATFIQAYEGYDLAYWASGKRAAGSSVWRWDTSQASVTYSLWAAGQPDEPTATEACMWFSAGRWFAPLMEWNDQECPGFNYKYYICEQI